MTDDFVGYVGDPDLHDGTIRSVHQDEGRVRVLVQSAAGSEIELVFDGVQSLKAHRAEGMKLYSLSEMHAPGSLRRFVFANWHEDDDAQIEVIAEELRLGGSQPR